MQQVSSPRENWKSVKRQVPTSLYGMAEATGFAFSCGRISESRRIR